MSLASKEFPHDPMMRKLHQIREKHYDKTKHLSLEEKAKRINEEAETFLKSRGYCLVPTEKGHRLEKVDKER